MVTINPRAFGMELGIPLKLVEEALEALEDADLIHHLSDPDACQTYYIT